MIRASSTLGVLLVIAVVWAPPARAQSPVSLTVDAGLANVTGGNYIDRTSPVADARVDGQVLDLSGTQVRLGAAAMQYYGTTTVTVAPQCSGCNYAYGQPLPSFGYLAVTLGIRRQLNAAVSVEVEGEVGTLHMWMAGTHVAAAWRGDIAMAVAGPVEFVVSGEILSWTPGGNTLHAYPITFGLRLN